MQVKRGAFCNTYDLHLATICFKILVLSIFEWPLKTCLVYFTIEADFFFFYIRHVTSIQIVDDKIKASKVIVFFVKLTSKVFWKK